MRRGFTLIELLVVMGIAALLAGMVVAVGSRQARGPLVQLAAEQTAALLRRARTMAIANQVPYTVVFNIANAPGSSGRVINNRTGGHWARIVKPAHLPAGLGETAPLIPKEQYSYQNGSAPRHPTAGGPSSWWDTDWTYACTGGWDRRSASGNTLATFAEVVEDIRGGWASERLDLPSGKVRFLALGDSDEGPRLYQERGHPKLAGSKHFGYAYGDFYPRPWFGWWNQADGRLYPWGGYDPNLPPVPAYGETMPDSTTYSGLFYQGFNETAATDVAALTRSLNPANRTYQVDWNGSGTISGADASRGPEDAWHLLRQGEVRPLINGEWGDFAIVFKPNGQAEFPPMKCNRRWYAWDQGCPKMPVVAGKATGPNTTYAFANGCGASDMAKNWSYFTSDSEKYLYPWVVPNGESIHYARHTHAAFITLAPDSPDDRDSFGSATEALRSMMPMVRVKVNLSGTVEVVPVRWNDGVLAEAVAAGGTPWPATPAVWNDPIQLHAEYRYGWLAETGVPTYQVQYSRLKPRGRPITDQVSPEMLSRRVWWIDGVAP